MKTLLEIFNQKPEAKAKFEEWLYNKYQYFGIVNFWGEFPFMGQYGYVLEWLREQGIEFERVLSFFTSMPKRYGYRIYKDSHDGYKHVTGISDENPNTALLTAIEKGIELL